MPLDAICLSALTMELTKKLEGAKIDKIQQPERDEVLLTLRCPGENLVLLISASADCGRAHITRVKKANPLEPPALCMLMRKHLLGGRITALEQPVGERVLLLRIDAVDELNCHSARTLVLELMGKGDYHFSSVAGPSLFGLSSVRMENRDTVRVHVQATGRGLYVLTVPASLAGSLSDICRSVQLFAVE